MPFDKSKLPSRHVSVGPSKAPHRSYYYAMGLTEEDIAKPFVAIASAGNDSAPCNTTLDLQADICREGVEEGGGMPRRFNTITVTDGIAMGHQGMKASLISREVIADSVELSVRGHCYDALVGFAGCDKSLPGMMMAMLRLNVPSVFVYGGSILPGRFHDKDVTVVDVFEAVGQHAAPAVEQHHGLRAGVDLRVQVGGHGVGVHGAVLGEQLADLDAVGANELIGLQTAAVGEDRRELIGPAEPELTEDDEDACCEGQQDRGEDGEFDRRALDAHGLIVFSPS